MENLKIKCRSCGKELESNNSKIVTCGCPNMATIRAGIISAVDLANICMLNLPELLKVKEKSGVLTKEDIMWQEARRNRKVRKLDFEIR